MVVGIVTHNKHFAFAVKVEVSEAGMTVLCVSARRGNGLVDSDGIQAWFCTAYDVDIVNSIAANQFQFLVAEYIAGQRHCEIATVVVDNTYCSTPEAEPHIVISRAGTKPFQRCSVENVAAGIYFWIAVTVEVSQGNHAITSCGTVGNVQQSAIDGVGAYFSVVTVDKDGALLRAVRFGIFAYGIGTVRDIDGVL